MKHTLRESPGRRALLAGSLILALLLLGLASATLSHSCLEPEHRPPGDPTEVGTATEGALGSGSPCPGCLFSLQGRTTLSRTVLAIPPPADDSVPPELAARPPMEPLPGSPGARAPPATS